MKHLKRAIGGIASLGSKARSRTMRLTSDPLTQDVIGFGLLGILGYANAVLFMSL